MRSMHVSALPAVILCALGLVFLWPSCSKDEAAVNPPPAGQLPAIDFSAASPSITVASGSGATRRRITGGTLPYTLTAEPDTGVAEAELRTDTLTVTPKGPGSTSLTITDSSPRPGDGSPKVLVLAIAVTGGTGGLTAYPPEVFVEVGHTAPTGISGGVPPYSIQTPPSPGIATAMLNENAVMVTGVSLGSTSMVVRDAAQPAHTVTIPITVNTGGGAIQITVGSGTTPSYSWTGGGVVQLHVINTTNGSFAWWITCPSHCIQSPVTHGTVPSGVAEYLRNEPVLTPGVQYQVVVSRNDGSVGNRLFTP
ncbi:MAG: hypothetical protein WB626_06725 [Bacteroidota bacterium]